MSDWRDDLGSFFTNNEKVRQQEHRSELEEFVGKTVMPALEQLAVEMKKHGRRATVRPSATSAALIVYRADEEEMTYRVKGRTLPNGVLPCAEIRFRERKGLKFITVESMFRTGTQDAFTLSDVTQDEIIQNFVRHYTTRVQAD
jgi:choline/glycine/proline betaine transport protein